MEPIFWLIAAKTVFSKWKIAEDSEDIMELLSIYAPANRTRMLVVTSVLTAGIALIDWWATHYISLGFLNLFPIIIFWRISLP